MNSLSASMEFQSTEDLTGNRIDTFLQFGLDLIESQHEDDDLRFLHENFSYSDCWPLETVSPETIQQASTKSAPCTSITPSNETSIEEHLQAGPYPTTAADAQFIVIKAPASPSQKPIMHPQSRKTSLASPALSSPNLASAVARHPKRRHVTSSNAAEVPCLKGSGISDGEIDPVGPAPPVTRGLRGQLAYDTQRMDAQTAKRLLGNRASAARAQLRRTKRLQEVEAELERCKAENAELRAQLGLAQRFIEQLGLGVPQPTPLSPTLQSLSPARQR